MPCATRRFVAAFALFAMVKMEIPFAMGKAAPKAASVTCSDRWNSEPVFNSSTRVIEKDKAFCSSIERPDMNYGCLKAKCAALNQDKNVKSDTIPLDRMTFRGCFHTNPGGKFDRRGPDGRLIFEDVTADGYEYESDYIAAFKYLRGHEKDYFRCSFTNLANRRMRVTCPSDACTKLH